MLARGRILRSTPMSSRQSGQIAVIGIDIGKNFFHVVGLDSGARLFCGKNGRVCRLKPDLRICHHALSEWKPALAHIISAASSSALATTPGCLQSLSPTSLPASLGAFWRVVETSKQGLSPPPMH